MEAAEMMTESPRTIGKDDTIAAAWDALQEQGCRHLLVTDADATLLGILSERDFAAARVSEGHDRAKLPVHTIMSRAVIFAYPETDLVEVIDKMLEHRIGAVPVISHEGSVLGIVSYVDILRSLKTVLRGDEDLRSWQTRARTHPI